MQYGWRSMFLKLRIYYDTMKDEIMAVLLGFASALKGVPRIVSEKRAPRQDLRVLRRPLLKYLSLSMPIIFMNYNLIIACFKALKLLIKGLYYKILNVFANCNYKTNNNFINTSIYF